MDDLQTQPIATQTQPISHRQSAQLPLFIVLVLILVGAVCGAYAWQHSKVTKLNTQVLSLKSQSDAQTSKIAYLNKQLSTSNKVVTPAKEPTANKGSLDYTAAITQAVKTYKDNVGKAGAINVTINGVTASGNAAYGTVNTPGQDGGGAWLAINSNGNWSVVSQGAVGVCKSQVQQYNLPTIWAGDNSIC